MKRIGRRDFCCPQCQSPVNIVCEIWLGTLYFGMFCTVYGFHHKISADINEILKGCYNFG